MKPSIFIGSSTENLELAYSVQENLEYDSEPTVWNQDVFKLSRSALVSLLETVKNFDFAVFLFTPDDITRVRDSKLQTVRDNIIFEFGLFIGAIGIERTFFVIPRNVDDIKIPTDLAGLTPGTYDPNRKDGNLVAALGPACNKIRKEIKRLGAIKNVDVSEEDTFDYSDLEKRRKFVIQKLNKFRDEALEINKKVESNEMNSKDAEFPLSQWKIKVIRFIERHIGVTEAEIFLNNRTSLSSGHPLKHYKSSYKNHMTFLNTLISDIEEDPYIKLERNENTLGFNKVKFIYR